MLPKGAIPNTIAYMDTPRAQISVGNGRYYPFREHSGASNGLVPAISDTKKLLGSSFGSFIAVVKSVI